MSNDTFDKFAYKWIQFWIVCRRAPRLLLAESDERRNSSKIGLVQNIQGPFASLTACRHLVDATEVRTIARIHATQRALLNKQRDLNLGPSLQCCGL